MVYKRQVIVMSRDGHQLDQRTMSTPGDNTQVWTSFRKEGQKPVVPAERLAKHPMRVESVVRSIWNTGLMVASHKVPASERCKDEGKLMRVQQMRGSSVAKIAHVFSRAHVLNPQVVLVDPFAGAGGTGVAARLLGCYFVGIEKDATCAKPVKAMLKKLEEDDGYEPGSGLMKSILREEDGT